MSMIREVPRKPFFWGGDCFLITLTGSREYLPMFKNLVLRTEVKGYWSHCHCQRSTVVEVYLVYLELKLEQELTSGISEAFRIYESIRRKTIDHAYKTACENWAHNKDSGRLSNLLAEWITPLSLMRQKKKITSAWVFDAMNVDISPPNPASRQSTASTVR